jgi:hypothetical protein
MREEDEILGVSDEISTRGTATPNAKDPTIDPEEDSQQDLFENGRVSDNIDSVFDEKEPDTKANLAGHTERATEEEDESNASDDDVKPQPEKADTAVASSDVELEREINQLFLGSKGEKTHGSEEGKPKIGAAKAKRRKRAEKQAALEAEGKAPSKSRGNRKVYDPSAAMQKARGETVTTGRKSVKKK